MKPDPTDLDREAATLFRPAPGMRVIMADALFGSAWVVICEVTTGGKVSGWRPDGRHGIPETWDVYGPCADVAALDTDDPATMGCMLAQVDGAGVAAGILGPDVPFDVLFDDESGGCGAFVIDDGAWRSVCYRGTSRAAALVAAMRALRQPSIG